MLKALNMKYLVTAEYLSSCPLNTIQNRCTHPCVLCCPRRVNTMHTGPQLNGSLKYVKISIWGNPGDQGHCWGTTPINDDFKTKNWQFLDRLTDHDHYHCDTPQQIIIETHSLRMTGKKFTCRFRFLGLFMWDVSQESKFIISLVSLNQFPVST